MRVPEGFQQIPGLSVCPKEWEVVQANEICSKITKGTTPPKTDIVEDGDIPFLRVNNLTFEGRLNETNELLFVSESAHRGSLARSIAYPNDILMNIVGPPLGKIVQLPDYFSEYNLNQAIIIYRLKSIKIDIAYFLNYLKSNYAQYWLSSRSKKTSGQQNLTIELCKELPVPLPSYPEQQKIAQILSTWDKAIEKLEALIAAKQKRKKALMQQLLTGKKRFAGFEEEWKKISLRKLGKCIRWVSYKPEQILTIETDDSIQLLRSTNIQNGRLNDKDLVIIPSSLVNNSQVLKDGDLAVCMANGSKSLVGKSAPFKNQKSKYTVGAFCAVFRPNQESNNEFIKFLFQSDSYSKELTILLSGSSINNLKGSDIEGIKFYIPDDKEEQQKIASVLTAADREIETHQKQLSALKEQKKGLMQQLLTGKKRVKVDSHV